MSAWCRQKKADGGGFLTAVQDAIRAARPASVPVIVNDRVDVALAAGADGVHVGQADIPCSQVRPAPASSRPSPWPLFCCCGWARTYFVRRGAVWSMFSLLCCGALVMMCVCCRRCCRNGS